MIDMVEQASGWQRVDRSINEARKRLEQASTEEQFQAICQFSPDMGPPIFGQDGPLAEMAHGKLLLKK